jgi:hypothetical protein
MNGGTSNLSGSNFQCQRVIRVPWSVLKLGVKDCSCAWWAQPMCLKNSYARRQLGDEWLRPVAR